MYYDSALSLGGSSQKAFCLTEEVWLEYSPIVTQFIADLESAVITAATVANKTRNEEDEDDVEFDDLPSNNTCQSTIEDMEINFSNTKLNPYTLWKMLERMEYRKTKLEHNGWEMDFWITFEKAGCQSLKIYGTGITFNLWLASAANNY